MSFAIRVRLDDDQFSQIMKAIDDRQQKTIDALVKRLTVSGDKLQDAVDAATSTSTPK